MTTGEVVLVISNLWRGLTAAAGALLLLSVLCGVAVANPLLGFWFRDSPPPGWGSSTPYWEPMTIDLVSGDGSIQLLDADNAFYACTDTMTSVRSGSPTRFATDFVIETEIWFANTYDSQNQVVVQLRSGVWGSEGALLAEDTLVVTNTEPPEPYRTYFGVIPAAVVQDKPLIVKIIYLGAAGDTRIYWDAGSYHSCMLMGYWLATETSTWGKIKALYRE